jgi:4-alpha-glucanotransferase
MGSAVKYRRFPRRSGILAHVTSLPSPYGVGDIGVAAQTFLRFLRAAGQTLWQLLPVNPTLPLLGNSPYSPTSAFAGNPLLIGIEPIVARKLLNHAEVEDAFGLPEDRVDYGRVHTLKHQLITRAFDTFRSGNMSELCRQFDDFRRTAAGWLDDFVLFSALADEIGAVWTNWPTSLREGHAPALQRARQRLCRACDYHAFTQFLFFEQWDTLRGQALNCGIDIIGDMPIFVAHESADVWKNRDLFKLNQAGQPSVYAGVPPDYFNS